MTHEEDLLHKRMKRLLKASPEGTVKFKNYKELCEKLKLPEKVSSSKKAQLSWLQKMCNLTRVEDSQAWYFTEAYSKEKINILLLQKYAPTTRPAHEVTESKGVYGIYIDDKLYYIGSSMSLLDRLLTHCSEIYTSKKQTEPKYIILRELIDKGGTLSFKVLNANITHENRYAVEYKYIRELHPILNGTGLGYQKIMYTSRKQQLIDEYKNTLANNYKTLSTLWYASADLEYKLKILMTLEDNDAVDEIMQNLAVPEEKT